MEVWLIASISVSHLFYSTQWHWFHSNQSVWCLFSFSLPLSLQPNDDPIHIISMGSQPSGEKPPEYETVVLEPPCYDDAIKLSPANLLQAQLYKDAALPAYSVLSQPAVASPVVRNNNGNSGSANNTFTVITIVSHSPESTSSSKTVEASDLSNVGGDAR